MWFTHFEFGLLVSLLISAKKIDAIDTLTRQILKFPTIIIVCSYRWWSYNRIRMRKAYFYRLTLRCAENSTVYRSTKKFLMTKVCCIISILSYILELNRYFKTATNQYTVTFLFRTKVLRKLLFYSFCATVPVDENFVFENGCTK